MGVSVWCNFILKSNQFFYDLTCLQKTLHCHGSKEQFLIQFSTV